MGHIIENTSCFDCRQFATLSAHVLIKHSLSDMLKLSQAFWFDTQVVFLGSKFHFVLDNLQHLIHRC